MEILQNTLEDDFVAALAFQRQRLLHHAGDVLLDPEGARKPDAFDRLTQSFVTSMELLKAAEERLADCQKTLELIRADRSRFQVLFDGAPTALLLTTSDTTIRSANQRATTLLGRDSAQLLGRDLLGMVDAGHLRGFREQLAQVIADGNASWSFRLRPMGNVPFVATAAVRVLDDPMTSARALYWTLAAA